MHLIVRDSASLDEAGEPQDLGLPPADFILLSFSDSDLATFRAAKPERLSAHFINLAALKHPISIDLFIEKTVPGTKAILLRLLGGLDYWRYGAEELAHACRKHGVALAAVPGDGRADPRLPPLSTVATADLEALDALAGAGGTRNAARAVKRLLGQPEETPAAGPDENLPDYGIYRVAGEARDGSAAIVFYRSYLLAGDMRPIDGLIAALSNRLNVAAYYVPSLKAPGVADWLSAQFRQSPPDVIVNTTAFSARGEDGRSPLDAAGCPVLQAALAGNPETAWRQSSRGLSSADLAMHVVLPEIDGRIFAGAISFKTLDAAGGVFHQPHEDGLAHLAGLALSWVRLRRKPAAKRKIALVLSTYPGRPDQVAHAVGLDGPESAQRLARHLEKAGYAIGSLPETSSGLVSQLLACQHRAETYRPLPQPSPAVSPMPDCSSPAFLYPQADISRRGSPVAPVVPASPLLLGEGHGEGRSLHSERLELDGYKIAFAGFPETLREAIVSAWGEPEDDPALTDGAFAFSVSSHANLLICLQPERGFLSDRKTAYHDPNLPPRHAYAAFYIWLREHAKIDALIHLGAHGTLEWLPGKAVALSGGCAPRALLGPLPLIYPFIVNDPGEAAQAKRRIGAVTIGHNTPPLIATDASPAIREVERLLDEYSAAEGLDKKRRDRLAKDVLFAVEETGLSEACGMKPGMSEAEALTRVDAFLCDVKEMAIRDGLHILDDGECGAVLRALDGGFIEPGPSGAPSRGRADVLPAGRNLYSVDPRTVPTPLACENGARMAEAIVARFAEDHGDWPKSMVLDLWGSQTMRTGGEELGAALALLGVKPVWDYQSFRVTGFEIVPLMKLNRPRVDVTLRISGLLRDMFPTQLALFHAAVQRVAALDEPGAENPLRGQRGELFRIFGAANGAYGAGAGALIDSGQWDSREDLGESYLVSSATAYSGEGEGLPAREAFEERVIAAESFVHVQDHRETDILSSLDFAAHEGGFAAAAAALGNTKAVLYHADTGTPETPRVRTLEEEAARVLHGRAISSRWLDGQMRHGFRGAAEVAGTVDSAFAFAATSGVIGSEGFEHLYDAYLGDPAVANFLARENSAALAAIRSRFKEAIARSLWKPRRNDLSALDGAAA